MLYSNHIRDFSLLSFILLLPFQINASSCETCSLTGREGRCHETSQCFSIPSTGEVPLKYCACSPGFRAFGASPDDTTQQFRLASPEGIVFVKPGIACNHLCDAWTLGSDGCEEVPISTECMDASQDNINEKAPASTIQLSAAASVTAIQTSTDTSALKPQSSMSQSTYSEVIPSPTRGARLSDSTQSAAATTTAFALGGLPFVQNTSFYASIAPVDWNSIVTSDNPGPQDILDLPGGSNATYYTSNSSYTQLNGTSTLTPITINPPVVHIRDVVPESVDWRERWGIKWLTTVQSQGDCGSCWSFATTALAETMVRIQFGMWSKRSEGDLRDSWGISCDTGNWPHLAAAWASEGGNGISDQICVPYRSTDNNYFPCADRSGRSLRLPGAYTFQPGTDLQEQKKWISEIGPLTCAFEVKEDFDSWIPSQGVYRWDGVSKSRGWHAVLIVGYDDVRGCWILRNSWGKTQGDQGYYYVAYGEVSIDNQPKTGITNVNPDPWSRRRLHNGNMIQSSAGFTHRDFQLARRGGSGGIMHITRNGGNTGVSTGDYSWFVNKERLIYTDSRGRVHGDKVMGQPTMLESSFNRNYEILYWEDTGYLNHWYYNQNTQKWFCTGIQGDGLMAGYPGFVQTSDSSFAIVIRRVDGTLWHFTRDPENADWLIFEYSIASGILQSGPALVEANLGIGLNNLYVVAVLVTGEMQMFWRDTAADNNWQVGEIFGSGVGDTPPVMIQSHFWTENENSAGAFQLVVVVGGKIQHWQRVNKDLEAGGIPAVGTQGEWGLVATFGGSVKHVWSLVHGSFNHALELVAEHDSGIMIHWRYTSNGWLPSAVVPGES